MLDANTRQTTGQPPHSPWLRRAVWARWILLACYLVVCIIWYFVTLWQFQIMESTQGTFFIATLGLFALQFLLLLGAPHVHWPRPRRKRSIFVSLAAGSVIAMLLSIGVGLACVSLAQLLRGPEHFQVNWSMTTAIPTTAPAPPPPAFSWRTDVPWMMIGIVLVAWAFWFLIFALVGGGEWRERFGRMYRVLISGTILELLITIPIDVQVRRRTSCYCGEGTFYSLAIGLTAVLWAFGPGVAILFLVRRHQRLASDGCCLQCGYNLRGLLSDRCPECGRPFRAIFRVSNGSTT